MFVLDTNTVIYFFKGMGNVQERIFSEAPNSLAIPSVVLYELELGIANAKEPAKHIAQLRQLTEVIRILPFDHVGAKKTAKINVQLEKLGQSLGPADVMIAGTVLAYRGVLVTPHTEAFSKVPNLAIEDWY